MAVKCIFFVREVTKTATGAGKIVASPVAKGPYAEYSQYTPSGSFEITTLNEAATEWFSDRIGKDVSIIIDDPAEED